MLQKCQIFCPNGVSKLRITDPPSEHLDPPLFMTAVAILPKYLLRFLPTQQVDIPSRLVLIVGVCLVHKYETSKCLPLSSVINCKCRIVLTQAHMILVAVQSQCSINFMATRRPWRFQSFWPFHRTWTLLRDRTIRLEG